MADSATVPVFDLLVVGGGINGAGIARDAAGRGLSVLLVEAGDLAAHTSSASTKLVHGGLRYLEHGEVRLVREALQERERLLAIAPHLVRPLRFVMPQAGSPRPAWMVRAGLFLYDRLGGGSSLPRTSALDLATAPEGDGLRPEARGRAFAYWDARVDDSRLVVANAIDAAARGATILPRTPLVEAHPHGGGWRAVIGDGAQRRRVRARVLVNAAGPWVESLLARIGQGTGGHGVRLVKGSHIVVPRLTDGDHAFLLQNPDRRVVFAIPYEGAFTLVGTTEEAWAGPPGPAAIGAGEIAYLCDTINRSFARTIGPADVAWSYAGIRPLHEDHAASASAVTRDYAFDWRPGPDAPPLLSVYGGKITTYRRLAEHALALVAPLFPAVGAAWTGGTALPGGDLPDGVDAFAVSLCARYPRLDGSLLRRLAASYGTLALAILGDARDLQDLGTHFGAGLFAREVDHLVAREWARSAEDVLWRRSKLGLHLPSDGAVRLEAYLAEKARKT